MKIILVIFGLAYLVSPMDILPDPFIPFLGFLDDTFVLGTILYMLRYNRLPDPSQIKRLISRIVRQKKKNHKNNGHSFRTDQNNRQKHTESNEDPDAKDSQASKTNGSQNAYEILGLMPGASKKDIQNAYKAAIKKYHPDKLSHLGDEFAHLANKKFLEIQSAYDYLMKL